MALCRGRAPRGVRFFVGALAVPTPDRERRPIDPLGILLNVTTFGLLTIGIQSLAQEDGAGLARLASPAASEIVTGALLVYLFARHELAQANPGGGRCAGSGGCECHSNVAPDIATAAE